MKFKAPIATVFAIAAGFIVLIGYFVETPILLAVRTALLQWGILLAATAMLVGIGSLLGAHWEKVRTGAKGSPYSALLILAFFGTFLLGIYDYIQGTWGVAEKSWLQWIFNYVQYPVQTSLMAVLAVALAYAAIRMLRTRPDLPAIIFLGTALLVLAGSAPLMGIRIPILSDTLYPWITHFLALAGARGILLGIALGTLATGLRVLAGIDRPYGG